MVGLMWQRGKEVGRAHDVLLELEGQGAGRFDECVLFYRFSGGPEGLRMIRGDEIDVLARAWFMVGERRLRYSGIERIDLGERVVFARPGALRWGFDYLKAFVPAGHGIAADSYMNGP